jgi:hypothetical protein
VGSNPTTHTKKLKDYIMDDNIDWSAPVYQKGYPSYDAVNREPETIDEYVKMLDDVSDERIEDLFQEMGIDIDLNKPWSDD